MEFLYHRTRVCFEQHLVRLDERADRGDAGRARRCDSRCIRSIDSANREHRQSHALAHIRQRRLSYCHLIGFAGRRIHGAENQVVTRADFGQRCRVLCAVHRASDHEVWRDDLSDAIRTNRPLLQMHASGASRECDVNPIVDQNRHAVRTRHPNRRSNQIYQFAVRQIGLANLHCVDAGYQDRTNMIEKTRNRRIAQSLTIGDAIEHRTMLEPARHGSAWVGPAGSRRRVRIADTSSESPAITVMTPMPLTAPRIHGLLMSASSAACEVTNRLWSQNADHGATTRMNPASRK